MFTSTRRFAMVNKLTIVSALLKKAKIAWLSSQEVLFLLHECADVSLLLCPTQPVRPEGGKLYLIDRLVFPNFRADGHSWRKRADGKAVQESHVKLKVRNAEVLKCYYVHADGDSNLQRRCYWQLDPNRQQIVLVHYLCAATSRLGGSIPGFQLPALRGSLPDRQEPFVVDHGVDEANATACGQALPASQLSLHSSSLPELEQLLEADLAETSSMLLPCSVGEGGQGASEWPAQALLHTQQLAQQAPVPMVVGGAYAAVQRELLGMQGSSLSALHPGQRFTGQLCTGAEAPAQQAAASPPLPVIGGAWCTIPYLPATHPFTLSPASPAAAQAPMRLAAPTATAPAPAAVQANMLASTLMPWDHTPELDLPPASMQVLPPPMAEWPDVLQVPFSSSIRPLRAFSGQGPSMSMDLPSEYSLDLLDEAATISASIASGCTSSTRSADPPHLSNCGIVNDSAPTCPGSVLSDLLEMPWERNVPVRS